MCAEKVRRREARYFFILLNSIIPHSFYDTAKNILDLEVLLSETNTVQSSKNITVTMAFLLINALKKLAIYPTQSTTVLQDKLKSVNA